MVNVLNSYRRFFNPILLATREGVVIKAGTSDPVAKAVVEVKTNIGVAVVPAAITTGGDGKFEFRNLRPDHIEFVSLVTDIWIVLMVNSVPTARDEL